MKQNFFKRSTNHYSSDKEVTTSPPSSATPLKNMVNRLGRGKVLRRADLQASRGTSTVLFMAAQKHFPSSVPSDTDDIDDTDYDAAAAYESDDST